MSHPLSFPAPPVPILGQPVKVLSFTILPLLECQCGQPGSTFQLIVVNDNGRLGSAPGQCKGCGSTFVVQGFQMVDGQLLFTLGMDLKQPIVS